jgi:hypothetical protein
MHKIYPPGTLLSSLVSSQALRPGREGGSSLATPVDQQMCKLKNNDGIKSSSHVLCSQLPPRPKSALGRDRGSSLATEVSPQMCKLNKNDGTKSAARHRRSQLLSPLKHRPTSQTFSRSPPGRPPSGQLFFSARRPAKRPPLTTQSPDRHNSPP